jgi:hypothetical protein
VEAVVAALLVDVSETDEVTVLPDAVAAESIDCRDCKICCISATICCSTTLWVELADALDDVVESAELLEELDDDVESLEVGGGGGGGGGGGAAAVVVPSLPVGGVDPDEEDAAESACSAATICCRSSAMV